MTDTVQSEAAKLYFSRELLAWYRVNRRDLPWRLSRDPYRIWVSEIMLQQTRVETVIPYFHRFLERFPTIEALAEAPEEDVLKSWEGLGYYSRARNLQAGAREVASRYGGVVPDDKAAVSGLKGVGPYTAGAIMSIAFNRPEPAVDGNVMRVLSRYFCLTADIAKPSTRMGIEKLAASLIPEGAAGDLNQALMEHGALTCTPKSPGCLVCPVMAHCEGRLAGMETALPVKTKAKPPRPELRLAALVEGAGEHASKVLVRRRPDTGLLARMWELPHVLAEGAGGGEDADRGGRRKPAARRAAAEAGGGAVPDGAALVAPAVPRAQAAAEEHAPDGPAAQGARGTAAETLPPEAAAPELDGSSAPTAEQAAQMTLLGRALAEETRLLVRPRQKWMEAEHVFSHIIWDVRIYLTDFGFMMEEQAASSADRIAEGQTMYAVDTDRTSRHAFSTDDPTFTQASKAALPEGYRWIGPEDMEELAFPNVFLRILRAYWEEHL